MGRTKVIKIWGRNTSSNVQKVMWARVMVMAPAPRGTFKLTSAEPQRRARRSALESDAGQACARSRLAAVARRFNRCLSD